MRIIGIIRGGKKMRTTWILILFVNGETMIGSPKIMLKREEDQNSTQLGSVVATSLSSVDEIGTSTTTTHTYTRGYSFSLPLFIPYFTI